MQITREKTPHCIECLGLTARFRPGNDEKFSCNLQTGRSNSLGSSLFHVADAAHFMCASLTRVPARASALLFSLFLTHSLARSLASLHRAHRPCLVCTPAGPTTHSTPSFHLVLHLSSTPDWESVSYNRRGKFSSGDFDGDAFSLVATRSPPFFPFSCASIFRGRPLCANIRGGWTRNEIFWWIPFRICLCVLVAIAKKRRRQWLHGNCERTRSCHERDKTVSIVNNEEITFL